jgi:hypothetical protein
MCGAFVVDRPVLPAAALHPVATDCSADREAPTSKFGDEISGPRPVDASQSGTGAPLQLGAEERSFHILSVVRSTRKKIFASQPQKGTKSHKKETTFLRLFVPFRGHSLRPLRYLRFLLFQPSF